jgi:type 1 glutamine amidotransferase
MRLVRLCTALALAIIFCGLMSSQQTPRKKKLLAIGEVDGFQHDSVSHAFATIERLGQQSGIYDTYIRTDSELLTKQKLTANAKNLDYFDAVLFYTTGELHMSPQQKADFLSFIKEDGKGFIGVHSALDTNYAWHEYGDMIGGYFNEHPWGTFDAPVIVEDPGFPAMKGFAPTFTIHDEIYQAMDWSRDKVRVLARLDPTKLNFNNPRVHRTDRDFAVAWAKMYGNGRVFYSTFGHTEQSWDMPEVQKMYLEAIKWAMKLTDADVTPRPLPGGAASSK